MKPTILHWLSLRPPNVVSSFFILILALILSVNKLKKRYQKSKAFWYQRCSIVAPTVLHSYTAGKQLLFCALLNLTPIHRILSKQDAFLPEE